MNWLKSAASVLIFLSAFITSGCMRSLGPPTVTKDRFSYVGAIGQSWKEQMLLNMIKMRYFDPPVFLDVAQVISQYSLEGQLSLNAPAWQNSGNVFPSAGGAARWADRPTITYNPLMGDRFIKSLLRPLSPASLFSLVQAGWPVDVVFALGVRAINGLYGGSTIKLLQHPPDPGYFEVVRGLRRLQAADAFGLRIEEKKEGTAVAFLFRAKNISPELKEEGEKVRKLLDLSPGLGEFSMSYGAIAANQQEIAVLTRSMLEMLGEAASGVEVPQQHITEKRVSPPPQDTERPADMPLLRVKVRSSAQKPPDGDVFAGVNFRDTWFWIDDRDVDTKRIFTFLMVLSMLAESGSASPTPVVSISSTP